MTTGQCTNLTPEQVDSVARGALPSSDERKLLAAFKGDPASLGPPEQLLLGLMSLPADLEDRLACARLAGAFSSKVEVIREAAVALQGACDVSRPLPDALG